MYCLEVEWSSGRLWIWTVGLFCILYHYQLFGRTGEGFMLLTLYVPI